MNRKSDIDRKLEESLLLKRRVEGDRLVLADEVLLAALDGSRPLTAGERAALQASPLTTRRLRQLALERRAAGGAANGAGNGAPWRGSGGMLRAADSGKALARLVTDDGWWAIHFDGSAGRWRVILQLDGAAPFASRILRGRPILRVLDGAGDTVLQGQLDGDGECEAAWPFADEPAAHFQRRGAAFMVEPA